MQVNYIRSRRSVVGEVNSNEVLPTSNDFYYYYVVSVVVVVVVVAITTSS